jgi:hypothetical protein
VPRIDDGGAPQGVIDVTPEDFHAVALEQQRFGDLLRPAAVPREAVDGVRRLPGLGGRHA